MNQRQIAMVMDLNKCIGCQTCTIACKRLWTTREGMEGQYWNTVNTQPGAGTPQFYEAMGGGFKNGEAQPGHLPTRQEHGEAWEFNQEEVFYSGKKGVQLSPQNPEAAGINWDEDQGAGDFPNNYYFYLPRICNHCTRPACKEACPRGAIKKRDEDGVVLIDEKKCKGYRFCQEACPYKKIYFNEIEGVSQKCIFCLPRVEQGVATACTRQCPARVRFMGYLDDPEGPVYKLVNKYKVALPLHPEYETEPNVFYVPPFAPSKLDAEGRPTGEDRIPMEYLESLFGKEVGDALERLKAERTRRKETGESELMDILISHKWTDAFPDFANSPKDIDPVKLIGMEV